MKSIDMTDREIFVVDRRKPEAQAALAAMIEHSDAVQKAAEEHQADWEKKMAAFQTESFLRITALKEALGTNAPIEDKRLYIIDASFYGATGIAFVAPNPETPPDMVKAILAENARVAEGDVEAPWEEQ